MNENVVRLETEEPTNASAVASLRAIADALEKANTVKSLDVNELAAWVDSGDFLRLYRAAGRPPVATSDFSACFTIGEKPCLRVFALAPDVCRKGSKTVETWEFDPEWK